MIETIESGSPRVVAFKLSGKLHDEDYKHFVPAVDAAVAHEGKVRLLAQFADFHGWDLRAAWDDFKFGLRHYSDFERIAMIGDQKWEAWMATFCKPFTKAKVRYFDSSDAGTAWKWVQETESTPIDSAGPGSRKLSESQATGQPGARSIFGF
jgi:hypothetical protein